MNYKIFVIYRKNEFYKNITDFINTYELNDLDINIFNCTDEELEQGNVQTNDKIDIIIKSIYSDNSEINCIILDSCIKYHNLNLEKIATIEKGYVGVTYKNFIFPLILNKLPNDITVLVDYNKNFTQDIVCKGEIGEYFIRNFFSKNSTDNLILNYMFGNLKDSENFNYTNLSSQIYHKFYNILAKENDLEKIKDLIGDKNVDLHMLFSIIKYKLVAREPDSSIVSLIISNYKNIIQNAILFRNKNFDRQVIDDYIINNFINRPRFFITNLPNWVQTGHRSDILEYYHKITKNDHPIDLPYENDNLTIISKYKFLFKNTSINLDKTTGIIYKNKQVFFLKSINPVRYTSIKNPKKILITYENDFLIKDYQLLGMCISYNNYILGILKEVNNSYKIILIENKSLKILELSNNFTLDKDMDVITLHKENNKLYIITSNKEHDIFKCKINMFELFINILPKINNNINPYKIKIDTLNTIAVKVIDFELEEFKHYKKYKFYNTPTEQKHFITANFNPEQKLLEVDNNLVYVKNFIFLHTKINSIKKTANLYFNNSAKKSAFYAKCVELQFSISDDYRECKYYIIEQVEFESLNSLELSNILSHKCLIISLIDEKLLNSGKLKSNYTSDEYLTKLFLFNIVQNKTYIEFIFDKIIHNNEYNNREEFMGIDLEHIEQNRSIYDLILNNLKPKSFDIDLSEKDKKLLNIIKSKLLNIVSTEKYNNILEIVKFIIINNYNISIGCIGIDNSFIKDNKFSDIFKILFKINWLGKIDFNISGNENGYECYIVKEKKNIGKLLLEKDNIVYIIKDNFLLYIN